MLTSILKMKSYVFADCHNDVVKVVELACKHNVCVIPYGGEFSKPPVSLELNTGRLSALIFHGKIVLLYF